MRNTINSSPSFDSVNNYIFDSSTVVIRIT
uniref:Uncharacterized protein n=1 Tax=Anguilla anguilla TaxID=7936 RepID=A0A0E9UT83_ANGAN